MCDDYRSHMGARGLTRSAIVTIAFLLLVGVGAVAPAAAGGRAPTPRQAAPDPYIDLLIDAPPAVRDSVTVRLTVDGADVSASCAEDGPDPGDQRRSVTCQGLADGWYSIDVEGVPGGHLTLWDCTDIVATSREHTAIPIGGGYGQWFCSVIITEPGVRLEWSTSDPRSLGLVSTPDGSTTADCIDDVGTDFVIRWCAAGLGAYEIEIVGEVGDESVDLQCGPADPAAPLDPSRIVTTADQPLGTCSLYESPQVAGFINWVAVPGDTAEWLTIDAIELSGGPPGADLSGLCELTGEASATSAVDFNIACNGLPSGSYSLGLVGVPPGHRVDMSLCPPFTIDDTIEETQAGCQIDVYTPAWLAGESGGGAGGEGDGGDGGDGDLPDAGSSIDVLVLLAALTTGSGLLLLAATARRPAARRPVAPG